MLALRQYVWERNGERTQVVDMSSGDYPRWVDTSVMLADPLTKQMSSERLDRTLETKQFDLRPTPESLMIKQKNRAARQKAKVSTAAATLE